MENLYQINRLQLSVLVFLITFISSFGQNSFLIYKIEGAPFLEVNDSIKSASKGSIIDKNTKLTMANDDVIYYLDNDKHIYKFQKTGTFKFQDLKKIEASKNESSFTENMFKYVWEQFSKSDEKEKNKSGVVYRGDNIILMRHPADSIKIFYPEIRFEWNRIEDKTKDYYFILRDVENQSITKIGLKDNSLSLFGDEGFLTSGKSYEWTITETKFPELEKLTFYSFKLLTVSEFEAIKKEIDAISKDLKSLGLSKNEIRAAICEDYKVCY